MLKKNLMIVSALTLIFNTSCFPWWGTFSKKKEATPTIHLSESTLALLNSFEKELQKNKKVEEPTNEIKEKILPKNKRTVFHGAVAGFTAAVHLGALDRHVETLATDAAKHVPVDGATFLATATIAALGGGLLYHYKDTLEKKLGKKKTLRLGITGVIATSLIPTLLSDSSTRTALIGAGKYCGEQFIAGSCYFLDCILQGFCKA